MWNKRSTVASSFSASVGVFNAAIITTCSHLFDDDDDNNKVNWHVGHTRERSLLFYFVVIAVERERLYYYESSIDRIIYYWKLLSKKAYLQIICTDTLESSLLEPVTLMVNVFEFN